MENIVSLRNISWITEEPVDLREYFDDYHKLLDEAGNSEQEMVKIFIMCFCIFFHFSVGYFGSVDSILSHS